jgi:arylsulfatase A-like enzyme
MALPHPLRHLPALLVLVASALCAPAASAKPNIVFLIADDLGYGDLSSYGAPDCRTPVLDALAASGARFTDAYAAFPVCSPSRAAILTGLYMQRLGPTYEDYFGGGSPGVDPVRNPTIGLDLKAAGYATACFGKWNINNYERETVGPLQHGFDKWVGFHLNHNYFTHISKGGELDFWVDGKRTQVEGETDRIVTDHAVKWIQAQQKERPFFIYFAFQAPHDPMQDPNGPPDQPEQKSKGDVRPLAVKLIENVDKQTGRVMDALKQGGFAENTLIIFTSDNGGHRAARNTPLRGHKQELYEGGVRVPLIVSQSGVVPAGQVIRDPVIAMDLTATMAVAGGLPEARVKSFDGLNLLPLLQGQVGSLPERPLFWRRRNVDARANTIGLQGKSIRLGAWKLLMDARHTGGGKRLEGKPMLFNLADDISEENNLVSAQPEIAAKLKKLLDEWEAKVDSDAAKSPIKGPLPPNGRPRVKDADE